MNDPFDKQIQYIIGQIRCAGYDPYAQLTEFVRTHDDRYITRHGNARSLILQLDPALVEQYIGRMKP